MAFTRKKMTDHSPKSERPSDVDWAKVAPPMVHVDHAPPSMVHVDHTSPPMVHVDHRKTHSSSPLSSPRLSVVTSDHMGGAGSVAIDSGNEIPRSASGAMVHVDHSEGGARMILELDIDQVVPNPRQPRSYFDEEELEDLASSIATTGVLQPVVVRSAGEGLWELIMGERRLRASKIAGRKTIPAIVREVPDDQLLKEAIIENIQRAALNPLEEALALQALLDDWGVSQEEVAKAVGKSRISVSHTLAILRLPEEVQRRIASGVISKGHAKILMGIEDEFVIQTLADRVVAETMSVRGLEEAVLLLDPQERRKARRGRTVSRRVPYPELSNAFEDALDTRVRIEGTKKRGRIVIEFGDAEDLRRISDLLGVRVQG